jgi:hypothetical protein
VLSPATVFSNSGAIRLAVSTSLYVTDYCLLDEAGSASTLGPYFSFDRSDPIYLDAHFVTCLEPLRGLHRKPDPARSVFVAIEGEQTIAGPGPHWAC